MSDKDKQNGNKRKLRVALAGNPNAGKTTLFNALTENDRHVANYPGVTVECFEGSFVHDGVAIDLLDLPGTYSLSAHSDDERVARNVLVETHPDLVVAVVDASNLERNLYLVTQIMELNLPLLLVFNKMDLAEDRGFNLDAVHLSKLFHMPIVATVGSRAKGITDLAAAIVRTATNPEKPELPVISYGRDIEQALEELVPLVQTIPDWAARPRWFAVKLLENDPDIIAQMKALGAPAAQLAAPVQRWRDEIQKRAGDAIEVLFADRRYGFISGACQEALRVTAERRHDWSDRVDEFVTHPVLGIPIFLVMMYALFFLTFMLGGPPMEWIEGGFDSLAAWITGIWPGGPDSILLSLLTDGIIGGVGGVLTFLPNIMFLFAGIALLEDSGYMARGAFIMDRFMHKIGLHGRSFIPMMVGFGCTVPAIMATRTLNNKRDRLTTILVLPLISCGARFPIYALFIPIFFPEAWRAPVLMSMYIIGIVLAAGLAKLLRSTILKGESSLFVIELPPYRMPTVRGMLRHTWSRGRQFIRKASTVILAASVIIWALLQFPAVPDEKIEGLDSGAAHQAALEYSTAGRIGKTMETVMQPIGIDWRATTALLGAFIAKEVFVAQLAIVYAADEEDTDTLSERLRAAYTPLQAFCIMLFCLISLPCVATCAATRLETQSWRWALAQIVGLTLLAYFITGMVFQLGRLLGL